MASRPAGLTKVASSRRPSSVACVCPDCLAVTVPSAAMVRSAASLGMVICGSTSSPAAVTSRPSASVREVAGPGVGVVAVGPQNAEEAAALDGHVESGCWVCTKSPWENERVVLADARAEADLERAWAGCRPAGQRRAGCESSRRGDPRSSARTFLKPVVMALARLLAMVSMRVCWASIPVAAV